MGLVMRFFLLICVLLLPCLARAAEPALEISAGGKTKIFSRDELLKRPDVVTIDVVKDATYGKPMTYRAVPVAGLLEGFDFPAGSVVEAVAIDGFAAQIPLDLMLNKEEYGALAWLAIEEPGKPWPKIKGKDYSAGPFYTVWTGGDLSQVRSEYWAYQAAKLLSQDSPATRWPELTVDAGLPADDPARLGKAVFIAQCLPCHKINGAGASDVGPDLNLPMNPTEYMTEDGLHKLIRDPKSVRRWPAMKMNGWPPELFSDHDIDLVVAYLKHMAGRKTAPAAQNP